MKTSHNKSFWVAGILATLALTTGVAFALVTQSVDTPTADLFTVTARVLVDDGGGTVYATRPGDDGYDVVEFSVVFDDVAGTFSINGGPAIIYGAGQNYRVTATCRKVGDDWVVDIVVRNGTGMIVGSVMGAPMGGRPTKAHATAEDVLVLTAE